MHINRDKNKKIINFARISSRVWLFILILLYLTFLLSHSVDVMIDYCIHFYDFDIHSFGRLFLFFERDLSLLSFCFVLSLSLSLIPSHSFVYSATFAELCKPSIIIFCCYTLFSLESWLLFNIYEIMERGMNKWQSYKICETVIVVNLSEIVKSNKHIKWSSVIRNTVDITSYLCFWFGYWLFIFVGDQS